MAIIGANKNLFSPWHTFCKSVLMFCKMSIICVKGIYFLQEMHWYIPCRYVPYSSTYQYFENINITKLLLSKFSLIRSVRLLLHHETTLMERTYGWTNFTSKGNMITYCLANNKGNNKHFRNYEVSWFFCVRVLCKTTAGSKDLSFKTCFCS